MTEMEGKVVVEASIEAVVTRADGTVEDLGVISFTSADPERQREWDEAQENKS